MTFANIYCIQESVFLNFGLEQTRNYSVKKLCSNDFIWLIITYCGQYKFISSKVKKYLVHFANKFWKKNQVQSILLLLECIFSELNLLCMVAYFGFLHTRWIMSTRNIIMFIVDTRDNYVIMRHKLCCMST